MKQLLQVMICLCLAPFSAEAQPAFEDFPYPIIAVDGARAFAEWQALRAQPGTPIILGPAEEIPRILGAFDSQSDAFFDPFEVALAKAEALQHPQSLFDHRKDEHQQFIDMLLESDDASDRDWAAEMAQYDPLEIPADYWGPWPGEMGPETALLSLADWQTGAPYDTVYITILPTDDPWQAPLYLRFGGWNANPPPALHAAAFRQWFTQYGAVPVVMQGDIVEFYVADPPKTRDAAQKLAREFYIYCNDIVDQGVGDMNVLAAIVQNGGFWYFWWD